MTAPTAPTAAPAAAPPASAAPTAIPPHPSAGRPQGGGAPKGELPPVTLEGWYAHHQLFMIDRAAVRRLPAAERADVAESAVAGLEGLMRPESGGWSAPVVLLGASADLMLVHFRPTLDDVGDAQRRLPAEPLGELLRPAYSFLSVTEAGMYQLSSELARAAAARGGEVGDAEYEAALAARLAEERAHPHVARRLEPPAPTAAMPYVCFYPMSKRRAEGQNWYALSIEQRSRLMWAHGLTGRRYAGKVSQIVTGAIGLDLWEWGVTLFAADPLEFKRIVTEMRFDEVSARYAEFGAFYVGRVVTPAEWVEAVVGG